MEAWEILQKTMATFPQSDEVEKPRGLLFHGRFEEPREPLWKIYPFLLKNYPLFTSGICCILELVNKELPKNDFRMLPVAQRI
jgi:hypothetical protein